MSGAIEMTLFISIICLTAVFVAVGISLFLLLRELHRSFKKINQAVEELTSFTQKLNNPAEVIPGLLEGVRNGLAVVGLIREFLSKNERRREKK